MKVSKCAEMWFFQKLNKDKSYSMWDLIDKLKWNKSLYEVIRGLNFCLSLRRLCDSGQGSGDVSQLLLLQLKYTFYFVFSPINQQGDSGNPIICRRNKVAGILSSGGTPCDNPRHPIIFTNIGFYNKWIKKILAI